VTPPPAESPAPLAPAPLPSAGTAPSAATPQPAAGIPARPLVLAVIGDSLTDPKSHGGGYLHVLEQHCPGLTIDNFGRGGFMVNQMRRTFEAEVAPNIQRYTHLLVFGGVNDLYSDLTAHRTPAKIETDLGYMYDFAKAHQVRVVAFTVAPWGGFTRYFNESRRDATHTLNDWIRALPAAGRADTVIDAFALLSCGDPEQLCERFFAPFRDGIHPGPEGHQILGKALTDGAFPDCH